MPLLMFYARDQAYKVKMSEEQTETWDGSDCCWGHAEAQAGDTMVHPGR